MKLICINNIGVEPKITIGKVYEGVEEPPNWFTITDDLGEEECNFYEWRFSTIQNWREKQLDKILI